MRVIANLIAGSVDVLSRLFRVAILPFSNEWMGLGNRLKGICNFYARGIRRFILLWRVDDYISSPFSELFQLKGCRVYEFNPSHMFYGAITRLCRRFCPKKVVTETTPFWSFIIPRNMIKENMSHYWGFSAKKAYSVDWWYDRTPENVREYFLPFFKALEPSAAVRKRIEEIDFDISNCVCVQIRFSGDSKDTKDVCSVGSIIRQMNRYPEKTHFFITYFVDSVGQMVKDAFPGRIHELPHKNCRSMVDAAAEIWLLGHGREIIASPASTFVEFAWWWGGCKQKVTEMAVEFNQKSLVS